VECPAKSLLKRGLPLIRANTPMQYAKLVVVHSYHSYGSRTAADLAKGALEDAGIQAMIQADTVGGMREHLAWSGAGFRILVRRETQPWRKKSSPDQLKATIALKRTSKLTANLHHRGAGLPEKPASSEKRVLAPKSSANGSTLKPGGPPSRFSFCQSVRRAPPDCTARLVY
jgi:hypothetical protein